MGESHNHAITSSRLGIRNTGGEIVEVQGGHIVRSTGRKDRHSKVCTAKGPRDRRVRLSAHTAIQFYDVQDRLGYDRPSKAVDWLIKKAKAAIDELAELPPWNPGTVTNTRASTAKSRNAHHQQNEANEERNFPYPGSSNDVQNLPMVETPNQNQSSSFLPPALDSDSIADTIKSFFPMGASTDTTASSIQFQNYSPDLLSRTTTSHSQDLRLSLQSFQEPNSILLQHRQQPHPHHHAHSHSHQHQQQNEQVQVLFSGTTPLGGYDTASAAASAWSESAEMSRFQRMVAWNSGGGAADDSAGNASGGGFVFNSQQPPPVQPLFGQNQLFHSQRGPLQSSNTPSVRAWIDQPIGLTNDHRQQHHHHLHHHQILQQPAVHQSVISGIGFASPVGEFSGFRIPARIQGEDEEHDHGIHNRPSSASSDSRH